MPGKTGVNPFESSQYSPASPFFRMPLVNLTANHEHCSKYDVYILSPKITSREPLSPTHVVRFLLDIGNDDTSGPIMVGIQDTDNELLITVL
jgi:hypothetical protein